MPEIVFRFAARKRLLAVGSGSALTAVRAKLTTSFNLVDTLSVGVDRIQRGFAPMRRQIEIWRKTQIADAFYRFLGELTVDVRPPSVLKR